MLEHLESLTVRQEVEMIQAFTGLETKNRYRILDSHGNDFLYAYEESGFFGRQFLGGHRPLTIKVINKAGEDLLVARRKFFWFFSHLEMSLPDGRLLGRLDRRFKLTSRRFELFEGAGSAGFVNGPLLRPNTFWFQQNGSQAVKITKRWSGFTREMLTAADTFQVEFIAPRLSESTRWLMLGAALAIDLDFFENRQS
jgi:hypothetical protein